MKILIVNPVGNDRWNEEDKRAYEKFASKGTEIEIVSLPEGPESLENEGARDAVISLIEEIALARCHFYDCVIVNCFLDPAVAELKERGLSVVGAGESSLAIASLLGERMAVLSLYEATGMVKEMVLSYGFSNRATVESLGISVADVSERRDRTIKLIEDKIALMNDFDVFVLGCTEFTKIADSLKVKKAVITPIPAAVVMAESLGRVVHERG
jgi:allantoin racemase